MTNHQKSIFTAKIVLTLGMWLLLTREANSLVALLFYVYVFIMETLGVLFRQETRQ